MKERYYVGIRLKEDLGLCEIYDDLERNDDIIIIDSGRNVLVHEMKYVDYNGNREDTGKTHIGFDFNYITFYYSGKIYTIEPSTYFPFTDENHPGQYNYVVYDIVDNGWTKKQGSYAEAYEGVEKLKKEYKKVRGEVPSHSIPFYVSKSQFETILKKQGVFREKDIYSKPHICYMVQEDRDHKIVRCARTERVDGVRYYFDIDVTEEKIVG